MVDRRRSLPPLAAAGAHRTGSRARGKQHGRIAMTDSAAATATAAAAHALGVPGCGGRQRESRFTTRGNNICSRAPIRIIIIVSYYCYVAHCVCILWNMQPSENRSSGYKIL